MDKPEQVYVNYIRSTPEKVWSAITEPKFCTQYWGKNINVSDWNQGSKWQMVSDDADRKVRWIGEVLESVPPGRLVLSWVDPDELSDTSRVTFEITPFGDMVRLIVTHDEFTPGTSTPGDVGNGWPRVLSSMKSWLETGKGLDIWKMKSSPETGTDPGVPQG